MPGLTATPLSEGQMVQLDVGAKVALLCRVIGFGGRNVMLAPLSEPGPAEREALVAGRDAYVLMDADRQLQALRVRLAGPGEAGTLLVRLTDGFHLGQRRRFSRAPLALPVRLRTLAGGDAWETVTRDVSAGGLRVAHLGAPVEGALEVVIEVASAGLRIAGQAEPVRATGDELGLRFTTLPDGDRMVLQQLAVAYYRLQTRPA
jgi:hypothetical protein